VLSTAPPPPPPPAGCARSGLLDYVLSDYFWARAVLLIGPTAATLGLSVQASGGSLWRGGGGRRPGSMPAVVTASPLVVTASPPRFSPLQLVCLLPRLPSSPLSLPCPDIKDRPVLPQVPLATLADACLGDPAWLHAAPAAALTAGGAMAILLGFVGTWGHAGAEGGESQQYIVSKACGQVQALQCALPWPG